MKRLPMILLMIAPYAIVIESFLFLFDYLSEGFIQLAYILFAIILLGNMIYAFMLPRLGFDEKQILFWNMLLKLCNIPVYLLVFAVALLTNIMILPLIPFLILFDYVLLLSTTMFGISGIMHCYRSKRLSLATVCINTIAQFFFCVDVCSAIYCYAKARKPNDSL